MNRRTPKSTLSATLFPSTALCRSLGRSSRVAPVLQTFRLRRSRRSRPEALAANGVPRAPQFVHSVIEEGVHAHLRLWHQHEQPGARVLGVLAFLEHTRSEEHTSELQSLMRISYAVFCLKKKNNTK